MTKRKLQRFEEVRGFPHFFQPGFEDLVPQYRMLGRWRQDFFKNENPLILELGCGKGEYTVGLARHNPDVNYIGVDIKGARMWRGAKTSLEEEMTNVAFLRTQIGMINNFFAPQEVDGIWITFPDPHPRKSEINKRLTSPRFLELFRPILKSDALIHLKTDDDALFEYTLEVIKEEGHSLLLHHRDLYAEAPESQVASIQTFYEKMWLDQGKKIKYLTFTLKADNAGKTR